MVWVSALLAGGCLAVAALHVFRLATRSVDLPGEAFCAVMGLGMAALLSPLGDPVPGPVWTAVFLLGGAWFGALALREGSPTGVAGHHVIGSVAMLFMLLDGHPAGSTSGGHAGSLGHGGGSAVASVVAIVLAGYFAWHVLRCLDRLRSVTEVPVGAVPSVPTSAVALRPALLLTPRAAASAHVVMAVAMVVMMLGMV